LLKFKEGDNKGLGFWLKEKNQKQQTRDLEIYSLEKPDGFTNKELFRMGFEQGLIRDAEGWSASHRRRVPQNNRCEL